MPWRGPSVPGEFPTLGYAVGSWIEAHCVIPDRFNAGAPFLMSEEQWRHLLFQFRLKPNATYNPDAPSAPFPYYGTVLVRPQKWGKGPFSAARLCAQAGGPALFAGWAEDYIETDWGFVYEPGDPVGMPWPKMWAQVTATSEDQTANIWRALKPMIEIGPLAAIWPDTGISRINLPNGGLIEPVTAEATSRLGNPIQYSEQDEIHSWLKRNGGHRLADTQRRNLAGTGGRWAATTNGWDPTENSIAQQDCEIPQPGIWIDYPEPIPGSWKDKRIRRRKLRHAYKGSPWVDLDRIEADCDRLEAKGETAQAQRFFGNEIVAGSDKAFDLDKYKLLGDALAAIPLGRKVTAGFDGALTHDATGLVITDIESGVQAVVACWTRPEGLHDDDDWTVPIAELDEAVDLIFTTWDVWRMYCDPQPTKHDINRWAGIYGEDRVVFWWTNERRKMAIALKAWHTDMLAAASQRARLAKGEIKELSPGLMSHAPLDDTEHHRALHKLLIEHVGNAVRWATNIRDDEDNKFLWLIGKDGQKSPRKIDLCMAAVLSWTARGDAVRSGVNNRPIADYATFD